jgi:hypothetical protein
MYASTVDGHDCTGPASVCPVQLFRCPNEDMANKEISRSLVFRLGLLRGRCTAKRALIT